MEFGFGGGVLTGVRTDVAGVNTPIRFGALQSVAVDFGGDLKTLTALYQFPIDAARGKTKISFKAKVAQIRAKMYNELFFGMQLSTGSTKFQFNESTTLGTGAASYTVANSASTPLTDQGVFLSIGQSQMDAVSSAPGSNQYTFTPSTGVYLFSTFSAGLGVLVNYTYTAATGWTITGQNPLMGDTPSFQATLFQKSPHSTQQIVLQLLNCVSNRLSFPTTLDDYTIQDLEGEAFANISGVPFIWSASE